MLQEPGRRNAGRNLRPQGAYPQELQPQEARSETPQAETGRLLPSGSLPGFCRCLLLATPSEASPPGGLGQASSVVSSPPLSGSREGEEQV